MLPEIVVIGSLNTDLVGSVERLPRPGETVTGHAFNIFCGGKGANQAYAAAQLGGRVAMIGCVGQDDFGNSQIENLAQAGVQVDFIERHAELPTGTAMIEVDAEGENRIVIIPGANGSLSEASISRHQEIIQNAKMILLQLEIPRATVATAIRIAHKSSVPILLDPAPASTIPADWLSADDWLTPNLHELAILAQTPLNESSSFDSITEAAKAVRCRHHAKVLAKLGHRGALLVTDESPRHFPAPTKTAVDTTAAGDCFNGAFATRFAIEHSIPDSIEFANRAAALSVTRTGAQNSMPTLTELETA